MTNTPPLRAILLARVSTPRQAEKYSLERQLTIERAYAEELGAEVVAEFKDDVSGRKLTRDGLTAAREMLANDEADALIVYKWNRLNRSFVDSVVLRAELRRMGKELHNAELRTQSGKTARQRLPEDLEFILAEIDADDIAERTAAGRVGKASGKDGVPGRWLGQGRPPYGYRKVGSGGSAYLEEDERAAPVVREIYSKYVAGWSTREIADWLTRNGYPTPNEHTGHPGGRRLRPAGEWSPSTVIKLIRHTAYSGVYYQLAVETNDDGQRRRRPKDERIPCEVPALVDTETWQAAQDKMDKGRTDSKRRAKHEYLLARRIKCVCGHAMRSATAGSSVRNGKPRENFHYYYRCTASVKDGWVVGDCNSKGVRAGETDEVVWDAIRTELLDTEALERKLRLLQTNQGGAQAERDFRLRAIYEEKLLVEDEIGSHLDAKARKLAPPHIIERKLQDATRRLEALDARIASEESIPTEGITEESIATILELSRALMDKLEEVEQTFAGRRTIIELLDVKVLMTWGEEGVQFAISSALDAEPLMRFVNRQSRKPVHRDKIRLRLIAWLRRPASPRHKTISSMAT